jgi:hypothetical protein
LRIHMVIPVTKSVTKAVVVGKGGELMQHYVVARAQQQLQATTGKVVQLSISVEVVPGGLHKFNALPAPLQVDALAPVTKQGAGAAARAEGGVGGGGVQAGVQEASAAVAELLQQDQGAAAERKE